MKKPSNTTIKMARELISEPQQQRFKIEQIRLCALDGVSLNLFWRTHPSRSLDAFVEVEMSGNPPETNGDIRWCCWSPRQWQPPAFLYLSLLSFFTLALIPRPTSRLTQRQEKKYWTRMAEKPTSCALFSVVFVIFHHPPYPKYNHRSHPILSSVHIQLILYKFYTNLVLYPCL